MDRTCSTDGRDEKFMQCFGCKIWREETTRRRCEDTIRMGLMEIGWEGVDIHLAQDTDQWRTLVNTVMNLLVP